jgi:hypothetical protein
LSDGKRCGVDKAEANKSPGLAIRSGTVSDARPGKRPFGYSEGALNIQFLSNWIVSRALCWGYIK